MSGVLTALLGSNPSGPQPSFELISTVYGTGSSGVITFSSIPSNYTHLQIRATVRANYSSSNMTASIRFNSDAGANYSFHKLVGAGSAPSSSSGVSQSNINIYNFPSNTAVANSYSSSILDILDYGNTNKNKTVRLLNGFAANSPWEIGLMSGNWRSTSAISSITITTAIGSFLTPTRFSLYGIKGA